MSTSLRDELASLKIDRDGRSSSGPLRRSAGGGGKRRGGRSPILSLLTLLLWLIPLAVLAGGGVVAYRQVDLLRPKTTVAVGLVREMTVGEAETLLSAKGYIQSRHQARIGAKNPGVVEEMRVEEGTRVNQGDVLAVLEHNDTLAVLRSREAMIARTEAESIEARADYELKQRKARRWAQLLARGTATEEEVDQYISEQNMARARVSALEAAMSLQRAMAQETQENINNMIITAPFAGTVVSREAEVGETITPGGMGAASGRGSVVTLADLDTLEVETDIAENLLPRVAVGQPAEISVSAVPGKHYRGRLRQIIPMGDRTRGTVKVNVEVLDPDESLFPELVATVHFLPDEDVENPTAGQSFLFVPKSAIVEEQGHAYAWVVTAAGAVERKPVEVVIDKDDLARVDRGLEPGDKVVLDPPDSLKDGEAVAIED